jgi:hypothetical protein
MLAVVALPLLAAAAAPASAPITVTGHAWAPFISPMGEPFRARSATDDTLARWFAQADRNHDGNLSADEMVADAERFFATLDADHNGEIEPEELANYEYEIAPDIQVMSKTRPAPGAARPKPESGKSRRRQEDQMEEAALALRGGLQGAARYGLLNMPEPVAAADADFDRGISLAEFRQAAIARFALLDSAHSGGLTLAALEALRPIVAADGRRKRPKNAPDARVGNPLPYGD